MIFTYKGGSEWAVFYIAALPTGAAIGRGSLDFTRYDTLILEAKGENGGERLLLNMKDADDPDDGSQTNIEIVLDDDWKTWEIALSDFETADLSRLNTVLNFLMIDEQEPGSFAVRTVAFR